MSALEARGVHLAAGGRSLVEAVDLSVAAGEMVVVAGPNGAGKSTLLRLLAGEARPTRGHVLYGGADIADLPPWRLALVRAVLPQSAHVAFPFRVHEVVQLGIDGVGRKLPRAARADIMTGALEAGDVLHLRDRLYQTLSGGERQRVQFARVLGQLRAGMRTADAASAPILLLDEPVSSLDLKHQSALLRAAHRLSREGVAVLAILHDLNLAAAFGDRLVVLNRGRVAARGTPVEVLTDALLHTVFEVPFRVGAVPPAPVPFVLPFEDAPPAEKAAMSHRQPSRAD
ncbi:iron complex transport system ATP-binding protein [Pseudochelatococcus lubricantis]|uniref:Iron complex transport system ATP-binding protein n=1 Tax=Pseudochelatococcus lubricantis TaxID=1538102 RepID=A0ABX0V228_9HYPH|nr:heme ABC transporter ATP-binding protein [Pseudochelatococcus lubricantis]NIJ58992.1 iron complex transport system ATP-binding protein [Pseudochelatococcus lubricantis]